MSKVYAHLATIPERIEGLIKVLASLDHQVDGIYIGLSGKFTKQQILDINVLSDKLFAKIQDRYCTFGDALKMKMVCNDPAEQLKGYHLICDDDIIYPDGYAEKMIEGIEKYQRKAVVSLHGRKVPSHKIESYYRHCHPTFPCRKKLNTDIHVQIPGTGVMAFHSDTIKWDWSIFSQHKNMADIWAGVQCKRDKVPVFVLEHEEGYIQVIEYPQTIWKQEKDNDTYQTEIVNKVWGLE